LSISFDGDWLVDQSKKGETIILRVIKRLHSATTKFQEVQLVETEAYGRALILDDSIQAAAKDEFIYHECLVHPAMLATPNPVRVAVLGGGEGATIREVLKHKSVESVTMIDIDREVVEFCREYLPGFSQGAFDDPRTKLVFDDARKWIEQQAPESLDVVIIDITEPLEGGPACMLFTSEFYSMVGRTLTQAGSMLVQAGPADPHGHMMFTRIFKSIQSAFVRTYPLVSYVPSFADNWGFVLACCGDAKIHTISEIDQAMAERISGKLSYYDGQTQAHIVNLPLYLRKSLAGPLGPFTDTDPPKMGPGIR